MIAFAKIWNRSVPTARMPFTPQPSEPGNDESAARADAARNETGTETDSNGNEKYDRSVE